MFKIPRALYLAVDSDKLRELRGTKGDAKRRAWLAAVKRSRKAQKLDLGTDWYRPSEELKLFGEFEALGDLLYLAHGQSFHKGQAVTLCLLDPETLPKVVEVLESLTAARFKERCLEPWEGEDAVDDQEGRPGVKEIAAWHKTLVKMRKFLRAAVKEERRVLFTCEHR